MGFPYVTKYLNDTPYSFDRSEGRLSRWARRWLGSRPWPTWSDRGLAARQRGVFPTPCLESAPRRLAPVASSTCPRSYLALGSISTTIASSRRAPAQNGTIGPNAWSGDQHQYWLLWTPGWTIANYQPKDWLHWTSGWTLTNDQHPTYWLLWTPGWTLSPKTDVGRTRSIPCTIDSSDSDWLADNTTELNPSLRG